METDRRGDGVDDPSYMHKRLGYLIQIRFFESGGHVGRDIQVLIHIRISLLGFAYGWVCRRTPSDCLS